MGGHQSGSCIDRRKLVSITGSPSVAVVFEGPEMDDGV
jgi:hypothetical protein